VKDFEENYLGLKENCENINDDIWSPERYSNSGPPKYETQKTTGTSRLHECTLTLRYL
jgi:hypothetical protein